MIANSLHKLSYANLPNLLDLIENLGFCISQFENAIKLFFQMNHELNSRLQVKHLARQGLS